MIKSKILEVCASALGLALLVSGCRREETTAYSVPKEASAPIVAASAPTIPTAGGSAKVHWKVPAGWQELPGNEMRLGNFVVPGASGTKAEVSVLSFPGSVGTEIDNVNRWRGQIGLDPIAGDQLKAETVTVGGSNGKFYDIGGGADKKRILAASVSRGENTWFFKMLGDDAVVAAQRNSFAEFLKSVSFDGTTSDATEPVVTKPVSTNTKKVPGATEPITVESAAGKPQWKAPADWTAAAASAMIKAKYVIARAENQKAEVTISSFPGDVGGTLANVNRWRGQLGLSPVDQAGMEKLVSSVDVLGGKAMLVEMNGTDQTGQKTMMIAAMVPRSGETWFYKLIGHPEVVAAQKEAFIGFVQSVRY